MKQRCARFWVTGTLVLCGLMTGCTNKAKPFTLTLEPYSLAEKNEKRKAPSTRRSWETGKVPECLYEGALYAANFQGIQVLSGLPPTRPADNDGIAVRGFRTTKVGGLHGPAVFRGLQRNEIIDAWNAPVHGVVTGGQDLIYLVDRRAFRWPNGGASSQLKNFGAAGNSSSVAAVGDMNGDGTEDFAVVNDVLPPTISVHSSGDGRRVMFLSTDDMQSLHAADMFISGGHDVDGDGRSDILVSVPSEKWWAVYDGNGKSVASSWGKEFDAAMLIGDQDRDGHGDILVLDSSTSGTLSVIGGKGSEFLLRYSLADLNIFPGTGLASITDVDSDGLSDWVLYGKNDTETVATIFGTAGFAPLCYTRSTREFSGYASGHFQSNDTVTLAIGESEIAGGRVAFFSLPVPVGALMPSRIAPHVLATVGANRIVRADLEASLGIHLDDLPEFIQSRVARAYVSDLALVAASDHAKLDPGKAANPAAFSSVGVRAAAARRVKGQTEVLFYEFDSGKEYDLLSIEQVEALRNLMCAPSYNGRLVLWLFELTKRFRLPQSRFCDQNVFVANRINAARYVAYRFGGVERRVSLAIGRSIDAALFSKPVAGALSGIQERKRTDVSYGFYMITGVIETEGRRAVPDREAMRSLDVWFSP